MTQTLPTSSDHMVETPHGKLFARWWGRSDGAPGAPAPIILFHDSLGSVELWRDFPEKLAVATGRAVLAYDRLGFGRSDPHPGRVSREFVQEESRTFVPALLSEFEIQQMIPFGHSIGGGMAIACGALHPDRCVAIIAESAQAFVEDRTLAGVGEAKIAFAKPDQIARLARYHGDKTRWVLDAWILTWLDPDFADWSLDADLVRLRCPLLAMHGDNDEFGSPAHPNRMAALAPTPAQSVIFEDCGHVPHREKSQLVLQTVRSFLTGLAFPEG